MAHESFEDEQVAEILNRDFICIKVDREERSDIDAVYMAVCQALTGSGGWPLTIIMTPNQKPFFAGTYLPKTSRYGMMGLTELLTEIVGQWESNRRKLLAYGDKITDFLRNQKQDIGSVCEPSMELLHKGAELYCRNFDKTWGGFGNAPKFPAPHNLMFLLRYSVLEKDEAARNMVERTLEQMFRGGIIDHIGGGFCRYSTDEKWLAPHFEKMLYDNALLTYVYLEAWKLTGRPLYRRVAGCTLEYVLRELTDEEGGFYCGQDADSDGVEGKYYLFTPGEIKSVLGESDGVLICRWFGITEHGNYGGKNIPNLIENARFEEENLEIDTLCRKLYTYRMRRMQLHKDDKVLTSWNGLMIASLAKAARVLDDTRYLKSAQKAQLFIAKHLTDAAGRLRVRWRDSEAAYSGQLDDYAFYAFGLLELYEAEFEVDCLQEAIRIAELMIELFFDGKDGGFYLYAADSEELISRPKEIYDGAMPSGNSVAALVLGRLARLTGETKWQEARDKHLQFLASAMHGYPNGYSFSLLSFTEALYSSAELICVTSDGSPPAKLQTLLRHNKNLNLAVLVKTPGNETKLAQAAPFTDAYRIPQSGTDYYLCRTGACFSPVQDIESLQNMILQL